MVLAGWETLSQEFARDIAIQAARLSELQEEFSVTRDHAAALLQLIYEKDVFTEKEWDAMYQTVQTHKLKDKFNL